MKLLVLGVVMLAVVGSNGCLEAQRQPGTGYLSSWEVEEARLSMEILAKIRPDLQDWQNAWNVQDIETLSELYAEDAMLFFTDRPLIGRAAIHEYFEAVAPDIAGFSMGMTDFQVSGRMARMVGTYAYQVYDNGKYKVRVEGPYIASFIRKNGHWEIRAQMFQKPFPG